MRPTANTGATKFLSTLSLRRATNILCMVRFQVGGFLSTLSLRRATSPPSITPATSRNFYPRSPCGERRIHYDNYNLHCVISIHALLAESDTIFLTIYQERQGISIHALLAESDVCLKLLAMNIVISIHALLAESDALGLLGWLRVLISIHALLAESDSFTERRHWQVGQFLSTLSLRRATLRVLASINCAAYFYPRSPCGERLASRLADMSAA